MKGKLMTTALVALLLTASNAMASVARQAVLGGQPVFTSDGAAAVVANAVNGSLWYDDNYNVFYNPAYVNDYKNYVTINKGFEGGWFSTVFDNFVYGVYVNRGQTAAGGTPGAAYGGGNFVSPGVRANSSIITAVPTAINTQRPIDFFFGGDMGIKWGLHVAWASNHRDDSKVQNTNADGEISNKYWHFDLGAEVMGFEPFIGLTALSNYENKNASSVATQRLDEFNIGTRYKYENWTPYVTWSKKREAGSSASAARQVQVRHSILGLGVGHDTKVADGVHIYKNLGFWTNSIEDDSFTAETARKYTQMVVPINFSIEAEATSWLVIRAGATYDFINRKKFARTSASDSVSVADTVRSQSGTVTARIGSTLKFGKLHIDSAFGNGAAGAAPGGETIDGTSTMGFDSQTFAIVSAAYHW